jgi:hypothetical protein
VRVVRKCGPVRELLASPKESVSVSQVDTLTSNGMVPKKAAGGGLPLCVSTFGFQFYSDDLLSLPMVLYYGVTYILARYVR